MSEVWIFMRSAFDARFVASGAGPAVVVGNVIVLWMRRRRGASGAV